MDTYPILVMLFLLFFPTHLAHSSGWRWGASDSISLRARVGSLPNYYHTLVLESGLRVKFLYTLVPATGNWSPQNPPTLLAPIHQRILRHCTYPPPPPLKWMRPGCAYKRGPLASIPGILIISRAQAGTKLERAESPGRIFRRRNPPVALLWPGWEWASLIHRVGLAGLDKTSTWLEPARWTDT